MLSRILKKISSKRIALLLTAVLFVAVLLFLVFPAHAQVVKETQANFGMAPVEQNIGLSGADIRLIIARIVRVVLGLLGLIAMCLILWAGYTIMTAGGNEEKIEYGKKILRNAVVGLIIILSAFAIVQFVINMLAVATGIGGGEPQKPKIETFAGSGALGKIIKDHYPARDQKDVPRNTKIMITFAEPMAPESFITNTNGTCWNADKTGPTSTCPEGNQPYFGDCVLDKPNFDWNTDCDHLDLDPKSRGFHIYKSDDATQAAVDVAAMASYDENGRAETFVFKPIKPLGDDLEKVWYTVNVNNNVKKANQAKSGAFDGQHYKFYKWEFQTDTIFDFSPPYVVSVYPANNGTTARNTIVQVNFNEAMDPMVVQGVVKSPSLFTHMIINHGKTPTTTLGSWSVSNGYRTAEFVPKYECGLNSCGEQMYCLEVDCAKNDLACKDNFSALVRTGDPINSNSKTFEAKPFSGVMDAAGNALDSNKDGKFQPPPAKGLSVNGNNDFNLFDSKEKVPDNYNWDFIVENKIDRTSPYITTLAPNLDQGGVAKDEQVVLNFSKLMWLKTLQGVQLEEYPDAQAEKPPVDFFFFVKSSLDKPITVSTIEHREFGPNGKDYYYYPTIPGTVKAVNQNCLYPGYGPGVSEIGQPQTTIECKLSNFDEFGSPGTVEKCAPVNYVPSTDTGCVQTLEAEGQNVPRQTASSTSPCLKYLKDNSPKL